MPCNTVDVDIVFLTRICHVSGLGISIQKKLYLAQYRYHKRQNMALPSCTLSGVSTKSNCFKITSKQSSSNPTRKATPGIQYQSFLVM